MITDFFINLSYLIVLLLSDIFSARLLAVNGIEAVTGDWWQSIFEYLYIPLYYLDTIINMRQFLPLLLTLVIAGFGFMSLQVVISLIYFIMNIKSFLRL